MMTSKECLAFILDRLSGLDDITFRAMMGGYIIYYRTKIIGGIYNGRFLIKPAEAARKLLPEARLEPPYDGAKDMLLVEDCVDGALLKKTVEAMYEELPFPKKKKK